MMSPKFSHGVQQEAKFLELLQIADGTKKQVLGFIQTCKDFQERIVNALDALDYFEDWNFGEFDESDLENKLWFLINDERYLNWYLF